MDDPRIIIPSDLQGFVDAQVASGSYSSIQHYVGDLIRGDARRRAEAELEALLTEGLDSPEENWTDSSAESVRRAARLLG